MRHLTKITQGLCKSVFTTTHPYIGRGDTWRTMTAPLAFTEVDDHILTEDDDFMEVKDAVVDVIHRWQFVAGAMGLRPPQIRMIEATHPGNLEACMDDAISQWLRRTHNETKHGPPTWRKLVQAIAAKAGGRNEALAGRIAESHPIRSTLHVDSTLQKQPAVPAGTSTAIATAPLPPQVQPPTLVPCIIRYTTAADGVPVSVDRHGINMMRFTAHESAKSCTAIEFSFGTVQVKNGQRQREFEAYAMQPSLHGICVIINNEQFSSHTKRLGTHVDEVNLTQCFRYLGYTVEVHRNVTAHQIETIFSYYHGCNHSTFDSFIVCILSHGDDGHIFGTDSKSVELQSIVRQLNAESCPSLAGKPKVFFIQACRGGGRVQGTQIASDSGSQEPVLSSSEAVRVISSASSITIPDDADFFFGNATPPGKVAWRDMDHGSWYISEICRSFSSLARYADLVTMVTKVHNEVGTRYENMNYRQAPEANTRLRKKVYFFD